MKTLTLDDATYAALARRAERYGLSVERWLAEELAAPATSKSPPGETALDAFERVGAIGCVKGGPSDVATNPKYMEGFGKS